jgi:protoporphyrinogen oxidase
LRASNALRGLGVWNSIRIIWSYLDARVHPDLPETTFEQWVCNRFGRRLYEVFFKTYTEKVWGIPCTEIRAEWAAQRIQGLSLARAVLSATALNRRPGTAHHHPVARPNAIDTALSNHQLVSQRLHQ